MEILSAMRKAGTAGSVNSPSHPCQASHPSLPFLLGDGHLPRLRRGSRPHQEGVLLGVTLTMGTKMVAVRTKEHRAKKQSAG